MFNFITPEYLRPLLPTRADDSHKGDYGHLLIVAGCRRMPGAALLATGAALQSGCGLVTLHSVDRTLQAAVGNFPSAMLSESPGEFVDTLPERPERFSAIAAGPGLGTAPGTQDMLCGLIRTARELDIPMVLDADALNILALRTELLDAIPVGSIMTPHPGELRRLVCWKTEQEKEDAVLELCRRTDCTVVVKGWHSRIYSPDGHCLENTTGNPGMAKGGSGDVLTGLIGGLLARGLRPLDAASLGVWIHGYAGDALTQARTAEAYSSRDLVDALWQGFKALAPSSR